MANFCSFFSGLSVCHCWRKHPGGRWSFPVPLDKKGMILEGLAFLGLPCRGWVAKTVLFAQGSEQRRKDTKRPMGRRRKVTALST